MQEISVQEAYALISTEKAYGVDVREGHEWEAGHAPSVSWNPLSTFNPNQLADDLPIIFICRSGARSAQVAMSLGLAKNNVLSMSGGMQAWQSAGFPMECKTGNPEVI